MWTWHNRWCRRLIPLLTTLLLVLGPVRAVAQSGGQVWAMPALVLGGAATVLLVFALIWIALLRARMAELRRERLDLTSSASGPQAEFRQDAEYRQVVEAMQAALGVIQDGKFVYANPAAARLLGWASAREIIGTDVLMHIAEDHRQLIHQNLEKRLTGELTTPAYEVRVQRKDGEQIWVELRPTLCQFNGQPAAQAVVREIHRHKLAEEALRRERSIVDRITATSPTGLTVVDRDGNIAFANTAAEEVLGLRRDEITQRAYNAPEWRITDFSGNPFPDAELPFRRAKETQQAVYNVRHAIEWPDGRRVRLGINASPLFNEAGEFDGMVASIEDITQRTRAEEIMRASEEKYSRLFQYSNDGIVLHDLKGRVIDINQRMLEMLGYEREEALGMSIEQFHPPEALLASMAAFETIERDGFVAFEVEFRTKDGEVFPTEVSSRLFELDDKKVIQGIVRDVRERRQAEHALRSSEQEKNLILSSVPDLVLYKNKELKTIWANRAAGESVGLDGGELVGRYCYEIWHQREEPCENCPVVKAMETGETTTSNVTTPDGRVWSIQGQPVTGPDGEVIGAVEVAQDITEQTRALAALKASEERFRSLMEHAQEPIAVVAGTKMVYANPAVPRVVGYNDVSELLDRPFLDFIDPADHEMVMAFNVARLRGEEAPETYELRVLCRDGSSKWVEITAQIMQYEGQPAVQASLHDIDARKRAEEALRESEEKFRSVVESSPMGMHLYELRSDGQLVFSGANPAADEILGVDNRQFLGKTIQEAFPPLADSGIPEFYLRAAREGVPWQSEQIDYEHEQISGAYQVFAFQTKPGAMAAMFLDITDRIRAADALKESVERYRLLAENVTDIIWTADLAGNITYVSPSVEPQTGHSVEEAMTRTFFTSLKPDSARLVRDVLAEELALDGDPDLDPNRFLTLELEEFRKDGSTKWIEVQASFLRDADGQPTGILGVSRDITERKEAEEALRESEERLRRFYDATFEGIAITDQGRMLDINRRVAQIYGYSPEELLGQPISMLLHPDDQALVEQHIRSGFDQPYEHKSLHKDGSVVYVEVRGQEFPYEGRVVRATAIHDITERKQAERALRESEERYRELIENMGEGLILVDPHETIQFANPAAERMFGVQGGRMVGRNLREYVSADDYQKMLEGTVQRRAGRISSYEVTILREDGEERIARITASPRFDSDGQYIGSFGPVRDITNEVMLERQLRQAQKMEALGTLAGGIAHDFNNILYAMLGFTTLALDEVAADSNAHADLQEVLQAGERASDLVKQILSFSRQVEQESITLHVHLIVHEAAQLLRASLPKNIEVRRDVRKGDDVIRADPTQIHQVIMNLCTNAAQAMTRRGGILGIELAPIEVDRQLARRVPGLEPGRYVQLRVSDTGDGMETRILERIFDPFFTTKEPGEGTGLGLAVVHGIVTGCGGAISVQSEPGKGTRFDVYFPRAESTASGEVEAGESPPEGRERLLVVEDEDQIARMLAETLTRLGYQVTQVAEGRAALNLFRADPLAFDLVITDQAMPGMSGIELSRELLKIRSDLPIVMCTGFSHTFAEQDAREAGIREFVMKPIMRVELSAAIRRALDRAEAAAAAGG